MSRYFRFYKSAASFFTEMDKLFNETPKTFESRSSRAKVVPQVSFQGSASVDELNSEITSFLYQKVK